MACFIVPGTEAIVTTVAEKIVKEKENKELETKETVSLQETRRVPFSQKLKWLNHMLWGGSALLAFEHVWHGEVTPFFPFLTAAANPADTAEMFNEMSTVGVTMAVTVTVVWGIAVAVTNVIEKRPLESVGFKKNN